MKRLSPDQKSSQRREGVDVIVCILSHVTVTIQTGFQAFHKKFYRVYYNRDEENSINQRIDRFIGTDAIP